MCGDWAPNVPLTHWVHQRHIKQVSSEPMGGGSGHDRDAYTLLGHRISVPSLDLIVYETKLSESTRPFPG